MGNAAKFLAMLSGMRKRKLVHPGHAAWSYGDKEYYWIACELAGADCTFNPRGRPVHLLNAEFANCSGSREGCPAHLDPASASNAFLYAHMTNNCRAKCSNGFQ